MVFFACLFAVIERDSITGGLVGLSISCSMQVNNEIDVSFASNNSRYCQKF